MIKCVKLKSTIASRKRALAKILQELGRAEKKFPEFPVDIIHRSAIISEEMGELVQACLDLEMEVNSINHVYEEATQVGAMAIRFLVSLEQMNKGY